MSFVPRLLMAWKLGSVCDDGFHYLAVAVALESGETAPLFEVLNVNTYPSLLALLHTLGLSWMTTAKLWGALVGGMTVLPIFGWVRCLFDDRVAVGSGFLYAVHPQFIELSVEPIREPTFWFLFMLSMYLLCRMLTEPAWWRAPLAGIAIALAAHTRSEGYLLLVPLLSWSAWHLFRSQQSRWRIAGRVVVCLSMTPLLLLAVNVTLLRNHPRWEFGRLSHFTMAANWLEENVLSRFTDLFQDPEESVDSVSSPAASSVAVADGAPPASNAPPPASNAAATASLAPPPAVTASLPPPPNPPALSDLPTVRTTRSRRYHDYYAASARLREFVKRLVDAFEPAGLFLLLFGLVKWWRQLGKPYKSALLLMTFAVLGVVWIQFANFRIGGRYFLTIVLILLPIAALGLLAVGHRLANFNWPLPATKTAALRLPGLFLCLLIVIGWVDALTSHHNRRERQAAFAERLSREHGPFNTVLVNRGAERFGYHVLGTVATVKPMYQPIEELIEHHDPQLMILSRKWEPLPERNAVLDHFAHLGWTHINTSDTETGEQGLMVFRRTVGSRTAAGERSPSVH
jgi:hypothetical protein